MDKRVVNEIFGTTQYLYNQQQNLQQQFNMFQKQQNNDRHTGKTFQEILDEIQNSK